MLEHDTTIAAIMVLTGAACYITAILLPLFYYPTGNLELELDL